MRPLETDLDVVCRILHVHNLLTINSNIDMSILAMLL